MKRTAINKVSKKKRKSLYQERKVRKRLIERSGGLSEISQSKGDFRGLQVHEKKFRSQGGKVSEENSRLITAKEHSKNHNIKEVNTKTQFRWIE